MAIPVRDLGRYGIVKDMNSYDLPPGAWSGGSNVRFHEGKVQRAPIFRLVESPLTPSHPAFIYAVHPEGAADYLVYAAKTGELYKWTSSGAETDVTPADFTPVNNSLPFTGCTLADVVYINRNTTQPFMLTPTGARFEPLPGWDESWNCRVLRSFKDYLIALNVNKGTTQYPTLVKWSHEAFAGQAPASWDHTDPTLSAGENPLLDATSEILDGLTLGNDFFVYTSSQVFRITYIGGRFIFDFRKAWNEGGIVNTNCVVEVGGYHYVFGSEDIYRHNGSVKESIASNRVRDHIFNNLNNSQKFSFFVAHNERAKEVLFCYVSGDSDVTWRDTSCCNRAAVYNYANDTWSFVDLPSVSSATFAAVNQTVSWETVESTWATVGGTWYGQQDGGDRHLVFVACQDAVVNSTSKLLGYDFSENGSTLAYDADLESMCDAYVERVGIDLDEIGAEIRGYKVCSRIYPQANIFSSSDIIVELGAALYSGVDPLWGPKVSFNPSTKYKVDSRRGGRYLSVRFTMPDNGDFEISGYDADITITGRR